MRIHRLLAPNPGLFTGPGTNTYVLEDGSAALIIDPGPVDTTHHSAIVEAVESTVVVGIFVTHSHPDHAPLANPLGSELDVPVYGYEPGPQFDPDVMLTDGDRVRIGDIEVEVVYTPGHSDDHLCLLAGDVLFTGDHIMGGSTVVVEDMVAYLASLRRLAGMSLRKLYPGHGRLMEDPASVIDDYISHRLEREEQIIGAVESGAGTVGSVVEEVYADVDPALHPLAAHSVAAHLGKLVADGKVEFAADPADLWNALVRLVRVPR